MSCVPCNLLEDIAMGKSYVSLFSPEFPFIHPL